MSKKYSSRLNLTKVFGTTIIATCFVLSALMGFFVTVGGSQIGPEPMNIPEIIDGVDIYRENLGTYNHDGDLTITNGGSLTLVNSTLNIEQVFSSGYSINVDTGSRLTLINSTITASANIRAEFQADIDMSFDASTFEMRDYSVLGFPGSVDFNNTDIYINDSWITSPWADAFTSTNPDDINWTQQFPTFNTTIIRGTYSPLDSVDNGPVLKFTSCDDILIADSRIDNMFEEEITKTVIMEPNVIGAFDDTTDPYIITNETVYGPATGGETGPYNLAHSNIINCTIYTSNDTGVWNKTTQGVDYNIVLGTGQISLLTLSPLNVNDTIFAYYNYSSPYTNNLADFVSDDGSYYDVPENRTMWIDGFDIGAYTDAEWSVDDVTAYIIYHSPGTNVSDNDVNWSLEGGANNTLISPISNAIETSMESSLGIIPLADIQSLNVSWYNYQGLGDGTGYGGIELLQLNVTVNLIDMNNDNMFYLDDSEASIINTYVDVDYRGLFGPAPDYEPFSSVYNKFLLENDSYLYLYNVTVNVDDDEDGTADYISTFDGDGNLKNIVESIVKFQDSTSEAFYYKWQDINVIDTYQNPVTNAGVNFTFRHTPQTDSIVHTVYALNSLKDNSATDKRILGYLDKTPGNYNYTDANGSVSLPLLTTILNQTTVALDSNGYHVGEYDMDIRFWNGTAWYTTSNMVSADFIPYPDISWQSNHGDLNSVSLVDGNILLDSLQLPRPDLAPGNIIFTPDEPNVFEGDTIDIGVQIDNLGLTNALNVYYEVYDNYGGNRDLIYNRTIPTIGVGGNVTDTFQWTANSGVTNYFEVIVDPFNTINEENESNNVNSPFEPLNVTPFLPELVVAQPDISFTPAPVSVGNTVTIDAIVHNQGFENASNVNVRFYYQNPDVDGNYIPDTASNTYLIGTDTIDIDWDFGNFVDPDTTAIATTDWTPVNDTDMDIYVWVDPLKDPINDEYDDETNNIVFNTLAVNPKPNLWVTSENFTFTGGTPIDDPPTPIGVDVDIWNLGGIGTGGAFNVEFYDGGSLFATEVVLALGAGATTTVSTTWTPSDKGYHDIQVVLDSTAIIDESIETDNTASEQVLVYNTTFDLIVNDVVYANSPFQVFDSDSPSFNQHGYVLVEENGVLEIRNSTFLMLQTFSGQFEITVRDSGTLILDNSTLSGNDYSLSVYLEDDATLLIKNSDVESNIVFNCYDNAQISIYKSDISAEIDIIGTNANVQLDVRESTIRKPLNDITGTSIVNLVAATMTQPTISCSGNSEVYIYRLLTVQVTDANGYPLENVALDLNYAINNPVLIAMLHQTGTTDANGEFVFEAMSDIITPAVYPTSQPVGSYIIDGVYTFQATPYADSQGVALPFYPDMDYDDNYFYTDFVMENVKPDLDPPLTAAPENVGRGETVWINTTLNNQGISPAQNILVRFRDETTGGIIEDVYIPLLQPAPLAGSSVNITVTTSWDSITDIGDHNISVFVDPYNNIIEANELDNQNWTNVDVMGMPDLEIETLGDILITPSAANRVRNNPINFQVAISNNGDVLAENVTLHIYEAEGGTLIGNDTIASIAPGQSEVTTVTWTDPGVGTYDIFFVVDEGMDINEIDETNNNRTVHIEVLDFSDVWISALTFELISNPTPITEVDNRTSVRIQAVVENNGELTATGVVVDFYDDTTGDWLGMATVPAIAGGGIDQEIAEIIWFATGTAAGTAQDHDIRAEASGNLYENTSAINNGHTETLTINDPRPDLTILSMDDIVLTTENVTEGQRFDVNVTVYNIGNGPALNVTVDLYYDNITTDNWLGTFDAGRLNAGANVTVGWKGIGPISDEGAHNIFAVVDMETKTDDNFTVAGTVYDLIGGEEEFNESNNVMNRTYDFQPSLFTVTITDPVAGQEVNTTQETLVVIGQVTNSITGEGIDGVNITVTFFGGTYTGTSSIGGSVYVVITVLPATVGTETITVSADGIDDIQIPIQMVEPGGGVNWLMIIILVVVIVGAAIGGITAYLYFFGLGKTVECGNCGAFIPESANKCPKCGTEFETETAKCSVCGAWVPMDAKTCPECESEFTIGEGEAIDYEAQMKKQYDNVVNGFKEQAKKELGNKYSEKAFQTWWAAQPTFITFEQWLKEEEEMKKMGSKPCPNCATPNSVTATICHKCGTVMEDEKKAPKKEETKTPEPKEEETKAEPAAGAAVAAAAPKDEGKPEEKADTPAKKKCPSCGMEVNADEKTCPICSYEWKGDSEPPKEGGGEQPPAKKQVVKKAVVQKPVRKVVRRPVKKQGE